MGLDAVVYKNRKHLKLGLDEKAALFDPSTGEVSFESDALSRKYNDQMAAVSFRLGNIAAISALRAEASRLLGSRSVVVEKVLYSGSHSGDVFPMESIPTLADEIKSIEDTNHSSPELRELASALKELVRAAIHEANPIVFV